MEHARRGGRSDELVDAHLERARDVDQGDDRGNRLVAFDE
jgi:hypothetical protein